MTDSSRASKSVRCSAFAVLPWWTQTGSGETAKLAPTDFDQFRLLSFHFIAF